jgi:hypothetical protein
MEAKDTNQDNFILILLAPVARRYPRIDVTDGAVTYMDIGPLVARQLWRLQRGTVYAMREGRAMLNRRDQNPFTGGRISAACDHQSTLCCFHLAGVVGCRGAHPASRLAAVA